MKKTYDSLIAWEDSGERNPDNFRGQVTSVRRGESDKDGWIRNNFKLRRIWINGRYGVCVQLMPHEHADQNVIVSLSIHQARWLLGSLETAIKDAETYQAKKEKERTKNRERRQRKKVKPTTSQANGD